MYREHQQWDKALAVYTHCHKQVVGKQGKKSLAALRSLTGLAVAHRQLGQFDEAIKAIHEALSIGNEFLGPENKSGKALRSQLVGIHVLRESYPDAIEFLKNEIAAGRNENLCERRLGALYAWFLGASSRTTKVG